MGRIFTNIYKLDRMIAKLLPWIATITVVLMAVGLYWGLFLSPADMEQGETVRIMYIHVPAASTGLIIYSLIACWGLIFLVWRARIADMMIQAAAPIGTIYTFLALVTGSLWGKPMWGTWWVWDARLTSTLILFFLYLGILTLRRAFEDQETAARVSAVVAMVGGINIPIIKFSVDWWYTLHQPASLIRLGGPTIDSSFLYPLLIMMAGFFCLFLTLLIMRIRTIILAKRMQSHYLRNLNDA